MKNNRIPIIILIILSFLLFLFSISFIIANQDEDINPPTGDPAMYTEYNNNSSN